MPYGEPSAYPREWLSPSPPFMPTPNGQRLLKAASCKAVMMVLSFGDCFDFGRYSKRSLMAERTRGLVGAVGVSVRYQVSTAWSRARSPVLSHSFWGVRPATKEAS